MAYRERQAEPLWHVLKDLRGHGVDRSDFLFDIGCGGPSRLNSWIRRSPDQVPKKVFGLDILKQLGEVSQAKLGGNFSYIYAPEGFLDWEVPKDLRGQFTLAIAINSWHWILAGTEGRELGAYQKAADLLKEGGYLAILHRLSPDPCPEITKIALLALNAAGIDVPRNEYDKFRRSTWKIPDDLDTIRTWADALRGVKEEAALQCTTWQSVEIADLWRIWASMNLSAFRGYFRPHLDEKVLQEIFINLDLSKMPAIRTQPPKKPGDPIRVRLTMHAAVQILRKLDEKNSSVTTPAEYATSINPSVATAVRDHVARRIDSFLTNDPWFGRERIIHLDEDLPRENDRTLVETLTPLIDALKQSNHQLVNVVMRSPRKDIENSVTFVPRSRRDYLEEDLNYLLKQKRDQGDEFLTLSEMLFEGDDAPHAVIALIGPSWSEFRTWTTFDIGFSLFWIYDSEDNLHAYSSNPLKFNNLPYLADFLWFLLRQAERETEKKIALCISACRSLANSKRKDSVSVTIAPLGNANAADYCFIIESLQVYAQVQEAIDSRKAGQATEFERWIKVAGHELTKLYSGLRELADPDFFQKQSPKRKRLTLDFIAVVMDYCNSMTVTEKGPFVDASLLRGGDQRLQNCERICSLAWKVHVVEKYRPTQGSGAPTWALAVKRFYGQPPIEVNAGAMDVGAMDKPVISLSNIDKRTDVNERKVNEWLALLVMCAVRNALKHTPSALDSAVKVGLTFEQENDWNCLVITIENTHESKQKMKRLEQVTSTVPTTGTFFVLEQYGSALFRALNISDQYTLSLFRNIFVNERSARIRFAIPVSRAFSQLPGNHTQGE